MEKFSSILFFCLEPDQALCLFIVLTFDQSSEDELKKATISIKFYGQFDN